MFKNMLRAIVSRGVVECAIIITVTTSIGLIFFYKVHDPYEAFFLMIFGTLIGFIILELAGLVFSKFEKKTERDKEQKELGEDERSSSLTDATWRYAEDIAEVLRWIEKAKIANKSGNAEEASCFLLQATKLEEKAAERVKINIRNFGV